MMTGSNSALRLVGGSEQSSTPASPRRPGRMVRRVVGVVGLVVTAALGVLFALGSTGVTGLVALEYRFGNPTTGLLVVSLLALVSLWLAFPLVTDARPGGRIGSRVVAAGSTVVALFLWGILGGHFHREAEEVARTDDGAWSVGLVRDADVPPARRLVLWEGSGWTAREVADLGGLCGGRLAVSFVPGDSGTPAGLEVTTAYGSWTLDLDPATGQPTQVLGSGCADDPVPVG